MEFIRCTDPTISSNKKTASPTAWSQLRSCAESCGRNAAQEKLSKSENREIALDYEPIRRWLPGGNLPASADYEYLYAELLRRLRADAGSHGYRQLRSSLTDELGPRRVEELDETFDEGYHNVWQEYWYSDEAKGHRLTRDLEEYLKALSSPFGARDSVPPYEKARQAPVFKEVLKDADLLPRGHLLPYRARERNRSLHKMDPLRTRGRGAAPGYRVANRAG